MVDITDQYIVNQYDLILVLPISYYSYNTDILMR